MPIVPPAPITPVQPVGTAKILDALPSLIGAIDQSLIDTTGEKTAFVLIVFAAGVGMHATNINPPSDAIKAVKALATNWDDGDAAG
jgi:hypothetical protein